MNSWLIHLLGGHTDNDILRTRNVLVDMSTFASKHANEAEPDVKAHFYDGKSQAFLTAALTIDDMVKGKEKGK